MSYDTYFAGKIRILKTKKKVVIEIEYKNLSEERRKLIESETDPSNLRDQIVAAVNEQVISNKPESILKNVHVLIVCDNPDFIEQCLANKVASIKTSKTSNDFFVAMSLAQKDGADERNEAINIVIFDIDFDKKSRGGLEVMQQWREINMDMPAIILSRSTSKLREFDLEKKNFSALEFDMHLDDELPKLIKKLV